MELDPCEGMGSIFKKQGTESEGVDFMGPVAEINSYPYTATITYISTTWSTKLDETKREVNVDSFYFEP